MAATALMDEVDVTNEVELDRRDDELYEVVDGQRMEAPPTSYYSGIVASELGGQLILQLHQQKPPPGKVVVEVLFRLRLTIDSSRKRRPDIAFVSFERWASDRPKSSRDNAWDVIPDLAVEVISPIDFAQQQLEKVLDYFQAGVRLVWVVYPEQRQVYIYDSPTQVCILTTDDTLDGGTVLPGFQLPLDRLFDPIAPPSDSP